MIFNSDVHKCYIPAHVIKNLPGTLRNGQKLLVLGTPHIRYFTQESGKGGTSIQITAKSIYLCDDGETKNASSNNIGKFEIKDQNKVEIFAGIPTDVVHEDKYSSFSLALHHLTKYAYLVLIFGIILQVKVN